MNNEQITGRRAVNDAIFRVLLSGIFLAAGANHLWNTAKVVARLQAAPLADLVQSIAPASTLVMAVGLLLLLGGTALLTGTRTRLASLTLMLVLVPITATVQLAPGHIGPLFKNVAIFGGLLHFWVNGAAGPSVDALLERRRAGVVRTVGAD